MPPTPAKTKARGNKPNSTSSSSSAASDAFTESLGDGLAVGLSDPGTAGMRKAMLQLINRLHDTGVQTDIDLPMIAVIGNQSAGKSSLIEAISGITLPRSSGTCTRCPTECKLSRSDSPWRCLVKLHFSTDARGIPIPVKVVPFGGVITSKSHVEDRIRCAQRAILNPSKDPNRYLVKDDLPDENEVSFSRNYVSLEISGSELSDLSFVDLPGLIASVGWGSDDRDIELVKSLVTSYIEKPSCVILLTVACETDFENQGAHTLAKRFDAVGKRTVGVLTKPDRIPAGEESSWLKILRNETEPLVNNWYCVKQPSLQDVYKGITWAEARQQEDNWFTSEQPWCSLELRYQKFLRTSHLTDRLSHILSELIAKRLPKIQEELMAAVRETDDKLRDLPKAPSSDPVGEVLHLLGEFTRDIGHRVKGTPEVGGLLQSIHPHHETFRIAIRRTAPNFVPWEKGTKKKASKAIPFLIAEEGDAESCAEDESCTENDEIYVDEVLRKAQGSRTRELPGDYPPGTTFDYIRDFMEKWNTPAMVLFDRVYDILRDDLTKLVEKSFANMGNGNAKRAIQMILYDHLDEAANRTKERIQWLLDLEQNPTTLNTHYFFDYKEKFLAHYKAVRGPPDVASQLLQRLNQHLTNPSLVGYDNPVNKVLSGLNEMGLQAQVSDIPKLLPPDKMQTALDIMASVRAYFQVAYKRFADIVPMAIDHDLVLGIRKGIDKALHEGLHVTGPDGYARCKLMLEEPIGVMSARQEIEEKKKRLQSAREELRRLM